MSSGQGQQLSALLNRPPFERCTGSTWPDCNPGTVGSGHFQAPSGLQWLVSGCSPNHSQCTQCVSALHPGIGLCMTGRRVAAHASACAKRGRRVRPAAAAAAASRSWLLGNAAASRLLSQAKRGGVDCAADCAHMAGAPTPLARARTRSARQRCQNPPPSRHHAPLLLAPITPRRVSPGPARTPVPPPQTRERPASFCSGLGGTAGRAMHQRREQGEGCGRGREGRQLAPLASLTQVRLRGGRVGAGSPIAAPAFAFKVGWLPLPLLLAACALTPRLLRSGRGGRLGFVTDATAH